MPYREVTMLETKEPLRFWLDGWCHQDERGSQGRGPLPHSRPGTKIVPGPDPAAVTNEAVIAVVAVFAGESDTRQLLIPGGSTLLPPPGRSRVSLATYGQ